MSNDVQIFNFSILGVQGFQSVSVLGSAINSRMRNAVANILQELNLRYGTNASAGQAFATKLLKQFNTSGLTHFLQGLEAEEPISNEKFLEIAPDILTGNTDTFLEYIDVLERRFNEVMGKLEQPAEGNDRLPQVHLFLCTGGVFGSTPFAFYIPEHFIDSLQHVGNGQYDSIQTYIRYTITTHLSKLKSKAVFTIAANGASASLAKYINDINVLHELNKSTLVVDNGPVLTQYGKSAKVAQDTVNQLERAIDHLELGTTDRLTKYLAKALSPK